MRFCVFFAILLALVVSKAEDCTKSVPAGADWEFARVILADNEPTDHQLKGMAAACNELDAEKPITKQLKEIVTDQVGNSQLFRLMTPIVVGVSRIQNGDMDFGTLGMRFGSKAQKAFVHELDAIKEIVNPSERIAKTAALVSKYRGNYDDSRVTDNAKGALIHSSSRILDLAADGKDSGVCRDYSNLLVTALNFVGDRAPNFSSIMYHGNGHTWVQANVKRLGSPKSEKIDLDPTAYKHDYLVALPVRSQKMVSVENRDRCRKIQHCLFQNNLSSPGVGSDSATGGKTNASGSE